MKALLRGNIIGSIQYNPIVLLFMVDMLLVTAFAVIRKLTNNAYVALRFQLYFQEWFLTFILLYTVARNLLLFWKIDLVGDFYH